jgi:hypothetical protein
MVNFRPDRPPEFSCRMRRAYPADVKLIMG